MIKLCYTDTQTVERKAEIKKKIVGILADCNAMGI